MNTQIVSVKSHLLRRLALLGISGAAALLAAHSNNSSASVIDLGAAGGYSVLTYNSSNNSDSAFQGGPIGVVNGNWTQSGGQQTGNQNPTTVFLSPGFSNNGPAVESTVINGPQLSAAWTAATNASAAFSALAPTQTLGAITTNTTITETTVGNYVLSISNISLNHPASLTLSAPAGSTFVLNISGSVTINGDAGSGLLIAGGLTSSDVVYNLTGSMTVLHTAGGGNGTYIQGTVLAPNGFVQLSPGGVSGEIIAQTFQSSSGTLITAPPPPMTSVPEASSVLPLIAVFGMVIGGPAIRRRFVGV